jgi:hypothetical protein
MEGDNFVVTNGEIWKGRRIVPFQESDGPGLRTSEIRISMESPRWTAGEAGPKRERRKNGGERRI